MPKNLEKYLPQLNATARAELFGSITNVVAYPRGDPIREGAITGALLARSTMYTAHPDLSSL